MLMPPGVAEPGDIAGFPLSAVVTAIAFQSITGPTGRAIGVDMTDEMLAKARANAQQALEQYEQVISKYKDFPEAALAKKYRDALKGAN